MKLINPESNPIVPTPNHVGATYQEIASQLVGAKQFDVKLGEFEPGGKSIYHSHPESEELFYILSGEITLVDVEKESLTAGAGQAIYIPANETHAGFNLGTETVVYLVIKAPRE